MALDATELRQMVIKPALEKLGLWCTAAEELVLGTAIVESATKSLSRENPFGSRRIRRALLIGTRSSLSH